MQQPSLNVQSMQQRLVKLYADAAVVLLNYIAATQQTLTMIVAALDQAGVLAPDKQAICNAHSAKLTELYTTLKARVNAENIKLTAKDIEQLLDSCTIVHNIAFAIEDQYKKIDLQASQRFADLHMDFTTKIVYRLSALIGLTTQISNTINIFKKDGNVIDIGSKNKQDQPATAELAAQINQRCITEFKVIGNSTLEFIEKFAGCSEAKALATIPKAQKTKHAEILKKIHAQVVALQGYKSKLKKRIKQNPQQITKSDIKILTEAITIALGTTDLVRAAYEQIFGNVALNLSVMQTDFAIKTIEQAYDLTAKMQKVLGMPASEPIHHTLIVKLDAMRAIVDQHLKSMHR